MEEAKKEAMDVSSAKKLDFNLPLLSIKRQGSHAGEVEVYCRTNSKVASRDADGRIPFCWEQAPGKPKDMVERNDIHEGETPRPRLPPCRWQPQREAIRNEDDNPAVNVNDHDDGCDADVDDYEDGEDDMFSDAVEALSLTEAIDIAQKAEEEEEEEEEEDHGSEVLNLESAEVAGSDSPNFMMERFLPDAAALAASSAFYAARNFNRKLPYSWKYPEEENAGRSYFSESPSPKGCGLEILFPWRMKHKLCSLKRPIRHFSPDVRVQSRQSISKQTKHKHCSNNNSNNLWEKYNI